MIDVRLAVTFLKMSGLAKIVKDKRYELFCPGWPFCSQLRQCESQPLCVPGQAQHRRLGVGIVVADVG